MRSGLCWLSLVLIAGVSPALGEPSVGRADDKGLAAAVPAGRPSLSVQQSAAPHPAAPKTPTVAVAAMKVVIVKSAEPGCEPKCAEWIAAQGMIDKDTLSQFKRVVKSLHGRKLPVLIDSGGGVVDDSLTIGRLIRANGLDVVVSKTVMQPCQESEPGCKAGQRHGGPIGVPVARLAKCASSCAFILAAGLRRTVGPMAFVGVHQVKTLRTTAQILQRFRIERHLVWGVPTETRRTLISEKLVNQKTSEAATPEAAYIKIAKYFNEMGVTDPIMPLLKSTPNSQIHWLTRTELIATGMATDLVGGGGRVFSLAHPAGGDAAKTPADTPQSSACPQFGGFNVACSGASVSRPTLNH